MTRDLSFGRLRSSYEDGFRPLDLIDDIYTETLNPVWISKIPYAQLQDRARALQTARAFGRVLPLYGIPFAVKDNIDVAGLPTTAACPAFAYSPQRSAHVVLLLEAAGAMVIGKTNLDQFAAGLAGTRSPYGACSSVFSADHVSGGSSSGSAVSVASGQVSFALGTDTAGSGLVPAALNNIVGLKPSRGLISTTGVVPACRSLDCVSVFAGNVADAARVLGVAQGYDPSDAFSRKAAPPGRAPDRGFRFAVPADIWPETARALHREAIDRLKALGGTAVPVDFAPFARAGALLNRGPFLAERLASLRKLGFERWAEMDPVVAGIVGLSADIGAVECFAGRYELARAARAADEIWQQADLMLLPTARLHPSHADIAADPIGVDARLGAFTQFCNLLDLCACAVPAGLRDDGLPYGVSLIAPAFMDAAICRLAARLHAAWPFATIGATGHRLGGEMPEAVAGVEIRLAVAGAHLTGQPLHHQLTLRDARFRQATRTAAGYRLFARAGTAPGTAGLLRDPAGAGRIEVEIFGFSEAAFGSFVAEMAPPSMIGTAQLEDGASVKTLLCEPSALVGATDITAHGGWRGWLQSRAG